MLKCLGVYLQLFAALAADSLLSASQGDGSMSRLCRLELVPAFVRLLRDNEAEVRVAAAGKLSAFCKILAGEAVISALLPCVKELSTDSSQFVRTALASVVMELAPLLGKAATIEHLLPVFLALLKDDYPDVRLNIISKLEQVHFHHNLSAVI
jgi:serine/threonine-protein phosphatase 2A regulatory subunit A